jgi:hypothetical protein
MMVLHNTLQKKVSADVSGLRPLFDVPRGLKPDFEL